VTAAVYIVAPVESRAGGRPAPGRLALMTKVARLYHEQSVRQPEIAERLGLSQSMVSRLLRDAGRMGIVRTIVVPPAGTHSDLETGLIDRFGLLDAVVADTPADDGPELLLGLGAAGASLFERLLRDGDRVGLSTWSSSLLAVVDAMAPGPAAGVVVQLLGGIGNPQVQLSANRLTERLASVTGAEPYVLSAPGVVASRELRDQLLSDTYLRGVVDLWDDLSVALVGIGSLQPSPLLKDSGNTVSEEDMATLREHGAVGDVCLHFFDEQGGEVDGELGDRVLGIAADAYRRIPRRVGVAGGVRKFEAIRASVLGGWVNVLVTDVTTARGMLADTTGPVVR
jgi:DNA-binding transcriptional regulator LsrR (DeoR family)